MRVDFPSEIALQIIACSRSGKREEEKETEREREMEAVGNA